MAAYRRVYDSRRLQADCQEPGSAPVIEYGLPLPFSICKHCHRRSYSLASELHARKVLRSSYDVLKIDVRLKLIVTLALS